MTESSNRKKKVGLPPGSMVYTGENPQHKINIDVLYYDDDVVERQFLDEKSLGELKKDFKGKTWINIDGIHNISLVKKIGRMFGLDELIMEDLVNSTQRAKVEERENYLFIVVKMLNLNLISKDIGYEQLSFIVFDDCLITFQETPGDDFDSIRTRLEICNSKIRKRSIGYLTYMILDSIVDNYFVVLADLEVDIDKMEAKIINSSTTDDLESIIFLKQKVTTLKRAIAPIRELITRLQTNNIGENLNDDMKIYLTDLSDHGIIVHDGIEILNNRVRELVILYNSTISNGTNDIMKILAIISTIFMPLNFLTSLYGMNFVNMPELKTKNGYFVLIGVMIGLVFTMFAYFKRKKWL